MTATTIYFLIVGLAGLLLLAPHLPNFLLTRQQPGIALEILLILLSAITIDLGVLLYGWSLGLAIFGICAVALATLALLRRQPEPEPLRLPVFRLRPVDRFFLSCLVIVIGGLAGGVALPVYGGIYALLAGVLMWSALLILMRDHTRCADCYANFRRA